MKTICIDFDGVIHDNPRGFQHGDIYGKPSKGAVFTINNLVRNGYKVVVLTARGEEYWDRVSLWLARNGFPQMEITNVKPPAQCYVDDKAIRFISFKDLAKYYL